MKQTKRIVYSAALAICALGAVTFSSCTKSSNPPSSSINYVNDTYTPITITVNGSTQTIPVGGSGSYIADAGTSASVSASTAGTYGETITWSFNDVFPSGGTTLTEPLDVDASYFYLTLTNTYANAATSSISVNYLLTSQTTENIVIPYTQTVQAGYYYAFANTKVEAFYSDGTTWTSGNLAIPNTVNASYTLALQ